MHDDNLKRSYQQRISQLTSNQKHALAKKLSIAPDKANAKLAVCVTMTQAKTADNKELKAFARSLLPEHFVPQTWQQVRALPRTSMGKIQRKNLQSFPWQVIEEGEADEGFDIFDDDIFGESTYLAPTNETETILAKIWSDVLGVGNISIHDEFLEVGGDSLLSIRILARINKAGLNIATEDFFEFPTIAGQAKAICKASENSYEQGSTQGKFALIPIQHWLFERIQIEPQHWNQSILLAVNEKLHFSSLERAFQKLLQQHDALRIAFKQNDEKQWHQEYLPLDTQLNVAYIDISQQNEQIQIKSIEKHCQLMNKSMNLSEGKLARMAFFETPAGSANKLAIVVHHLIIDAESWRVLLEDLQTCWLGFTEGRAPALPRKTTSFKHWSEKLGDYAQSDTLKKELSHWRQQTSKVKIPLDFGGCAHTPHHNTVGSSMVLSTSLTKENTALLLQYMPKKLKVNVRDALIFSLVSVIHNWTHNDEVIIDIEGHGREDLFEKIDISRTIAWFTTVFPVLFHINSNDDPIETLLSVSNTLSAIPKKGIGHGLLMENRTDSMLKQQAKPEVCFNYLGQVDAANSEMDLIAPVSNNIGEPRNAACLRAFHIEVNAKIENSQLYIDWSYSRDLHKTETIDNLATDFIQTLTALLVVDAPLSREDDDIFDLTDLEDSELDAIAKALSGEN